MNQEKFGKFIKEIRKKNNLTQKQFAEKYNVTYQAVSKWENGKNMPDTYLIKQISEDFNISLEEIFDGELKKTKINLKILIPIVVSVLFIIISSIVIIINNDDFDFKTLSSSCKNFNISGNIAYNKNKSSIYITNIEYCGKNEIDKYQELECSLYEKNGSLEKKIGSYSYKDFNSISLEEFLKKVTLVVDDYPRICKEYSKNNLYLLIEATTKEQKITAYKIPLSIEENCLN